MGPFPAKEVGQNPSLKIFIGSGISKSFDAGVQMVWRQFNINLRNPFLQKLPE